MNYCEKCRVTNEWPIGFQVKTKLRCQCCDTEALCFQVGEQYLTMSDELKKIVKGNEILFSSKDVFDIIYKILKTPASDIGTDIPIEWWIEEFISSHPKTQTHG